MNNWRSHLIFTKSQQNGIFLLVVLILVLQMIYMFVDFNTEEDFSKEDTSRIVRFQLQMDSLNQLARNKDTLRIYPFNPNLITDYKGYTLGMSVEEIDRLLLFRKADKWVNSAEEFQKVTLVSDSLLGKISPYFKFPDWVKNAKYSKKSVKAFSTSDNINKLDLNSASIEELVLIRGIGEVLASRIVKYRTKIGGFVSVIQLKDIYGLNAEARNEILKGYSLLSKPEVKISNINNATLLELAAVPYLNYELAREIIDYKMLHEKISSFEELAKIKGFPSEKIDRIALYLTIE